MTIFKKTVLAAALLSAGAAFAVPSFAPGLNEIAFQSIENQYRPLATCGAFGGCLAAGVGTGADPAGYRKVDPSIANNFVPDDVAMGFGLRGDIFAGVLYITSVLPNFDPVGEFTGYFAQRIKSIDATVPTAAVITFDTVAPADDPFGKLAAGEMFTLYTDATIDFNPAANITAAASVNNATTAVGGVFWGSLGLGLETYAYTIDNLLVSGADASFVSKTFYALNLINTGPSYNLNALNKINDNSESLNGGTTLGNAILCSGADLANPLVKCTDFAGNADIKKNTGTNPWYFRVNDPVLVHQVPEPGSLALMGLALAGVGLVRRLRAA